MQQWASAIYKYIYIYIYIRVISIYYIYIHRVQWLRGRALDSRLREPGFESCAAVLKPWASFFTLHCSSSLSCLNEYLAIDNGGFMYEQSPSLNCSIRVDASQTSRDGV